jgi:anion-transporting  ArsA/GET3 family ATPase
MQKIIFVTGKGGVGKSSYAAALAQKYAKTGKKTLLVELGDQSFYQEFFSLPGLGYAPQNLVENLDLALWTGADCLKEYALYLLKSEVLYKLFFENKVSRALINVAPALPELAILGKITAGPRKHGPPVNHEVIIVDGYATGHFLALLKAPLGMSEVIKFGPMGEQSRSIFKTIMDPNICEYHVVTLAEELPYLESMELCTELQTITKITPRLIFNRILSTSLTSADLNPCANDFQNFLKQLLANQEDYLDQAQKEKYPFQKLELLNTNKPLEFIEQLGAGLSL